MIRILTEFLSKEIASLINFKDIRSYLLSRNIDLENSIYVSVSLKSLEDIKDDPGIVYLFTIKDIKGKKYGLVYLDGHICRSYIDSEASFILSDGEIYEDRNLKAIFDIRELIKSAISIKMFAIDSKEVQDLDQKRSRRRSSQPDEYQFRKNDKDPATRRYGSCGLYYDKSGYPINLFKYHKILANLQINNMDGAIDYVFKTINDVNIFMKERFTKDKDKKITREFADVLDDLYSHLRVLEDSSVNFKYIKDEICKDEYRNKVIDTLVFLRNKANEARSMLRYLKNGTEGNDQV